MERQKFGSIHPRPSRGLRLFATVLVIGSVVISGRPVLSAARPLPRKVFESSLLVGEGDAPPTFIEGPAPAVPEDGNGLRPTVICRLRIDASGNVVEARVYRSRPDLAAYESAAVAASRSALFLPARHGGRPVAAWLNWPVAFASGVDPVAESPGPKELRIKGSETIGGEAGLALAKEFERRNPKVRVRVERQGSSTAFLGLLDGTADLGASSRPATKAELAKVKAAGISLSEFVLGYDGITVIVHPDNPIRSLSLAKISDIFTGKSHQWNQVGGKLGEIHPIGRPPSSGTRVFFRDRVLRCGDPSRVEEFAPEVVALERNEDIVEQVARDPQAIAYVGHGFLQPGVKVLAVSAERGPAYLPETRTIAEGRYPIHRPLLLYTRSQPSREVARFLRFALSPLGQGLVAKSGFVPSDTPLDAMAGAEVEEHAKPH